MIFDYWCIIWFEISYLLCIWNPCHLKLQKKKRVPHNPNHVGIEFVSDFQHQKFDAVFERGFGSQKFASKSALIHLHVDQGVRTLFRNISWEELLNHKYRSYRKPTVEFLSSFEYQNDVLSFRLCNQIYQITADELTILLNAPVDYTFPPNFKQIPDFSATTF